MGSTTKFVAEFCDIIDSYGGRDKVSNSWSIRKIHTKYEHNFENFDLFVILKMQRGSRRVGLDLPHQQVFDTLTNVGSVMIEPCLTSCCDSANT